jgi:geranylgeranyl diphosphate synthase type I
VTLGQHLDLDYETRQEITEEDYLEMIEGKTASLIAASCAAGAMLGGASSDRVDHFRKFGHHMGMAFQILDDILGIWGAPEITGKPSGDDLISHKKSLPVVFGLTHCESFLPLWNLPRPSATDIDAMKASLESCGALAHAQSGAGHHTDLALEHLELAKPAAPAADQLRNLANRLLTRSR